MTSLQRINGKTVRAVDEKDPEKITFYYEDGEFTTIHVREIAPSLKLYGLGWTHHTKENEIAKRSPDDTGQQRPAR